MIQQRLPKKPFVYKTIAVGVIATAMLVPAAVALAWCTSQSANTSCADSGAVIHVSFTNTESDTSNNMYVEATDNQTGNKVNLGVINAQETKSADITTGKSSLQNGTITYKLTWANGKSGSDTSIASYGSVTCQTTQSPTPTDSTTPDVTPTDIPSITPTPTCEETGTPTVTPTVTPTSTPAPTVTPQVTTIVITATPTPNTPTINVVVQSVQASAPAPKVESAPKTQTLPKTGSETNILLGLLSLIPAGLKLRKMK